jgi:CheY-like chemotaxis protein
MSDEREGRILIVDDQRDVARILKSNLDILKRGYLVVEVPSGEEALLELQRKEFDVLVTDYRLPGMKGSELIERARRRTPNLKAIMITGTSLDEVRKDLGSTVIEAIFLKPVDTDIFAEAVEQALLGEQAMPDEPAELEEQLSSVPEFPEAAVARHLSFLLRDLGASAIVFVDRTGKTLLMEGALDKSLRFSDLAVLLAQNFITTVEISNYLGNAPSSAVHYYDGNWHDIYALSVGMHFFLVVVFPGGSQKQMGAVLRFGKPAVQEIIQTIGEAALTAFPEEYETLPEEEFEVPAAEPVDFLEEAPAPPASRRPKTSPLPTIDLDLDSLDAELAGVGGEADNFWEAIGGDASGLIDDTISADEAMQLGLLSQDDEGL